MIDPALASDAIAAMMGDRTATHGDPMVTLSRIAAMWNGYLGRDDLGVADVAAMMVLLKLARARHAYDRDHFVDVLGYTMLAEGGARP